VEVQVFSVPVNQKGSMSTADLSSIPLFASLPADEIRRLERLLPVSTFPPGEVLFQEGTRMTSSMS